MESSIQSLREMGGQVSFVTHMKRADEQPNGHLHRFKEITVRVALAVPWQFKNQKLMSVTEISETSNTTKVVASLNELSPTIQTLKQDAFRLCIRALVDDIERQMRILRSTVSNRKVNKKVRAVLKQFGQVPPKA